MRVHDRTIAHHKFDLRNNYSRSWGRRLICSCVRHEFGNLFGGITFTGEHMTAETMWIFRRGMLLGRSKWRF